MTENDRMNEGVFFYEGHDREAFVARMYALGYETQVTVTVSVPADKLAAFQKLNLPVGS